MRSAPPPPPPPTQAPGPAETAAQAGPQEDAEFGAAEPGQDASFGEPEDYGPREDADFGYDEQYGAEPAAEAATTPVVSEPLAKSGPRAKLGRSGARGGQGALLVAGWSLLGLFVVGVLGIFLLMPASVMAALPGSAHLYQAMGITPVEKAELGFEDVSYTWTRYQGQRMLQVQGQIVNFTPDQKTAPNVLIALLDADGEKISEWMAPAGETGVPGNSKSEFATQIPSPPDTVRSFRVRFQKEG